ncbi:hypothetical protein PROSTU_01599 [Providencia stuartii ATCC 25827]|uniref:Uncharacterized protein n=1 Tax=Providencia stuartii ATCC 25827 TaxID=471874 RepID=A0AA87CPW2_PROST|nr:hypothetical protein PROSTU_01599 [Providencia stuartii ATCC 25827]
MLLPVKCNLKRDYHVYHKTALIYHKTPFGGHLPSSLTDKN